MDINKALNIPTRQFWYGDPKRLKYCIDIVEKLNYIQIYAFSDI